jgi:hypothetical protein
LFTLFFSAVRSVIPAPARGKATPVQIDSDVAHDAHVFSSFHNAENQAE